MPKLLLLFLSFCDKRPMGSSLAGRPAACDYSRLHNEMNLFHLLGAKIVYWLRFDRAGQMVLAVSRRNRIDRNKLLSVSLCKKFWWLTLRLRCCPMIRAGRRRRLGHRAAKELSRQHAERPTSSLAKRARQIRFRLPASSRIGRRVVVVVVV